MPRRRRGPWILHEHERNWVYALWAGEVCLYVGLTNNLPHRLSSHRNTQPWWHEVDRIVSDEVIGREAAMIFEEHDIKKYRPLYNIAHNPDRKKDPFQGIAIVEERGIRRGP